MFGAGVMPFRNVKNSHVCRSVLNEKSNLAVGDKRHAGRTLLSRPSNLVLSGMLPFTPNTS